MSLQSRTGLHARTNIFIFGFHRSWKHHWRGCIARFANVLTIYDTFECVGARMHVVRSHFNVQVRQSSKATGRVQRRSLSKELSLLQHDTWVFRGPYTKQKFHLEGGAWGLLLWCTLPLPSSALRKLFLLLLTTVSTWIFRSCAWNISSYQYLDCLDFGPVATIDGSEVSNIVYVIIKRIRCCLWFLPSILGLFEITFVSISAPVCKRVIADFASEFVACDHAGHWKLVMLYGLK